MPDEETVPQTAPEPVPEPAPAEQPAEAPPAPVEQPPPAPKPEPAPDVTAKYVGYINRTFVKGEKVGTIVNFERKALAQGVWGPTFWVNYGNPRILFPMNADLFLKEYKEKGN